MMRYDDDDPDGPGGGPTPEMLLGMVILAVIIPLFGLAWTFVHRVIL